MPEFCAASLPLEGFCRCDGRLMCVNPAPLRGSDGGAVGSRAATGLGDCRVGGCGEALDVWVMRSSGARRICPCPRRALALAVRCRCNRCSEAAADTLEWALVQAYQNNPSLNAQRAALRATDENVPQALSGYRPKLSVTANGGYQLYQTRCRKSRSTSGFPELPSPISNIAADVPTRAASAPPRRRRSSTASRPPTARVRRKAR